MNATVQHLKTWGVKYFGVWWRGCDEQQRGEIAIILVLSEMELMQEQSCCIWKPCGLIPIAPCSL